MDHSLLRGISSLTHTAKELLRDNDLIKYRCSPYHHDSRKELVFWQGATGFTETLTIFVEGGNGFTNELCFRALSRIAMELLPCESDISIKKMENTNIVLLYKEEVAHVSVD